MKSTTTANAFLRWLTEHTTGVYWHDSAVPAEIEQAVQNGAVGVTTNPFLVNGALQTNPGLYADKLKFSASMSPEERVEQIYQTVLLPVAELFQERYDGVERGYVCAQVNPLKACDAEYMYSQAKRMHSWAPNICVKLPGTAAGVEAFESLVAEGVTVAVSVSFTVPQVLAVAEAHKRAVAKAEQRGGTPGNGMAVLMIGRLDDYLRDVAADTHAKVSENDIIQAGIACAKRAYGILEQQQSPTLILPAACRGNYHMKALAGAHMVFSVAPSIAAMLESEQGGFSEDIDTPVPSDVVERLLTLPEFRKAYEPDGMKPEEFITYGPLNRTLTQFIESGWNPLTRYGL